MPCFSLPAHGRGAENGFPGKHAAKCKCQKERRKMVRKTVRREMKDVRGGHGTVIFEDVITKDEFNGHGSLYARVTLPAGSSIGYHQHIDNTEQYFVLSGHGVFIDTDGSRVPVGPGDVCYIEVGQSHGMENPSDQDMVMMALIYNK